jgi:uncharacterized protein
VKILVLSDTHGAIFESIVKPIRAEKDIDLMIHCGDKYKDAEKLAWLLGIKDFYRVTGNCDYDIQNRKDMLVKVIEGKNVLITHGHLQYVKDDLDNLKELAEEKHIDIVLYGHTHIAHEELCNNVLYFNPGSTIMPKYGKPSYGIVEITTDKVLSKIVNL